MVKTFVINLKRSPERRRHIVAECERHGLDFEVVEAIDGLLISDEELEKVIDKSAVDANPGYLSRGMLAASLSHRKAYQRFLDDGGDVALIVEDDAEFELGVSTLISEAAKELSISEVALLFYISRDPLELSMQSERILPENRRLLYPMRLDWVGGGPAYLITREAAEKMVNGLLPLKTAPDSWFQFVDSGLLDRVRMIYPPAARVLPFKSEINRGDQSGLRRALTDFISKYKIPIAYGFIERQRKGTIESMSSLTVTNKISPYDMEK